MLKLSTTIGFEDVAEKEVKALIGGRGEQKRGFLLWEGGMEEAVVLNLHSRTLTRVGILKVRGRAKSLEEIARIVKDAEWNWLKGKSFGVESSRNGVHSFNSLDMSRTVGRAVIESCDFRPRVDLSKPDVKLMAYLDGEEFYLWMDTSGRSLHRRGYRAYEHPASLKTSVAAAMLLWSGWRGEALYDPMCGGGTFLCEASLYARGIPPSLWRTSWRFELPHTRALRPLPSFSCAELVGSDLFEKHVQGALKNCLSAGAEGAVFRANAESMCINFQPDLIITNPPYGLRIASKRVIKRLYKNFALACKKNAIAKIAVLTAEGRLMERAFLDSGYVVEKRKKIVNGNLPTDVLLFVR